MPTSSSTMRAVIFDAPASDASATHVRSVAVPTPGPGEVAIDVAYAGVNFKDVMSRRGDAGYVSAWPFVPGLEASGRVRSVGPGVDGVTVGQRVVAYTGAGALAEVAIARAALVAPVADGIGLDVAATAPGALATAVLLLRELGRLRAGEVVLVHSAAGGVGSAVAQLASSLGAGVLLGTVGAANRVDAARAAGYDEAFVRGAGLAAAIRERLAGRGVDLVLDPQGTSMLDVDLEVLAPGGRVVLFGNASGAPLGPLPAAGRLYAANASIGGFSLAAIAAAAPERLSQAVTDVLGHLAAGDLAVEFTVHDGLESAGRAQQALAEGRADGKHVVRVS